MTHMPYAEKMTKKGHFGMLLVRLMVAFRGPIQEISFAHQTTNLDLEGIFINKKYY